ncbi:MAG: hypothetical protein WB757_12875 [Candidatus Cybelea sp.]
MAGFSPAAGHERQRGHLRRGRNHRGGHDGYAGIVDTLRAIGAQHPDAMWLVHAWWVDSVVE